MSGERLDVNRQTAIAVKHKASKNLSAPTKRLGSKILLMLGKTILIASTRIAVWGTEHC